MKTIWKYPLQCTDHQEVMMPEGSKILCVQTQAGRPCLWALVDADPLTTKHRRRILVSGTGHHLPEPFHGHYIGTFQLEGDGALVFHVFDII